MHHRTPFGAALLLAVAATACLQVTSAPMSERDAGAVLAPEAARAVAVDFGSVPLGQRAERQVTVRNDGLASFEILEARRGASVDESYSCNLDPFTLAPGEQSQFVVTFQPSEPGAHRADFELPARGGALPELVVHATGTGVTPSCSVAPELAFGPVLVGEAVERSVEVINTSDFDWAVTVAAPRGGGQFAFARGFSPGEHLVPPRGKLAIPIAFVPRASGPSVETLPLTTPEGCGVDQVALRGSAVASALDWAPNPLRFGYRNVGERLTRTVRIENRTDRPRTVSRLAISDSAGDTFRLETLERTRVIAAEESWEVPIGFKARSVGELRGALTFAVDTPGQPPTTLPLIGSGGGPEIAVATSMDFGVVATGMRPVRLIPITNRGTDAPGTDLDALRFGEYDERGNWQERKPELTPATGDFAVEAPSAISAGHTRSLRVVFAPRSPGPKQATLNLYTNDPDQPTVAVSLSGEARAMPPCSLTIRPAFLDFGTVAPGSQLTLPLLLENGGTTECGIAMLQLDDTGEPGFSLVNGPIAWATIPAGSTLVVPVRFSPEEKRWYSGAVRLLSSGTPPQPVISLSGSSASTCLALSPASLDFGPTPTACSSIERSVTLSNTCAGAVTVDHAALSGLSSRVTITQRPALPTTIGAWGATTLKLRYRPALGADHEVLEFRAGLERRLLPVTGSGVSVADRADEFEQSRFTSTDMLLVLDATPSMAGKQMRFLAAFNALAQAARASASDFHLGVTSVGVDPNPGSSAANGRLLPLGAPVRVFTRANIDQFSSQPFFVGSVSGANKMLLRPAFLAVSAPLVTTENVGFLRPFANLAVVIMSDADDLDAVPVADYVSFFKSLKRGARVTVSAIAPTLPAAPSNCSYDESPRGDRSRVADVVTATGGVLGEVCAPSWLPVVDQIAALAFPQEHRFPLSSAPDLSVQPEPIRITVDGQPLPIISPAGDPQWSFDANTNEIVFRADIAPPPFSKIAVKYRVACLP